MQYGIIPTHLYHLGWLAVPMLLWLVKLPTARLRQTKIFHHSALAVAYWEELLFRGLVLGTLLSFSHNMLFTLLGSSILFGLFHLRNLWWATSPAVVRNCLYAGLLFGPIAGGLRWWSGDIYAGIAFHALSNFVSMYVVKNDIPTDQYLRAQQYKMNWFEKLFSGLWLGK